MTLEWWERFDVEKVRESQIITLSHADGDFASVWKPIHPISIFGIVTGFSICVYYLPIFMELVVFLFHIILSVIATYLLCFRNFHLYVLVCRIWSCSVFLFQQLSYSHIQCCFCSCKCISQRIKLDTHVERFLCHLPIMEYFLLYIVCCVFLYDPVLLSSQLTDHTLTDTAQG